MPHQEAKTRPTNEQPVSDEGVTAASPATTAAASGSNWMSHISYYQDYMTVIELEDATNLGIRAAS